MVGRYCLVLTIIAELASSELRIHEIDSRRSFENIYCLRVLFQADPTTTQINLLICESCDIVHLLIDRTGNSTWEISWSANISHARCNASNPADHIFDAEYLNGQSVTSNRCGRVELIFTAHDPSQIFRIKYEFTSQGQIENKETTELVTLENRKIGYAHALHRFTIGEFRVVLIADSYGWKEAPGHSIMELDEEYNTINRSLPLDNLTYPYDFSDVPGHRDQVFLITNKGLHRLTYRTLRKFEIERLPVNGAEGSKVLALTSDRVLVIPNNSYRSLNYVNLKNHSVIPLNLQNYTFCGIDSHLRSDTLFLNSKKKIYYSAKISELYKPVPPPTTTTQATTALTTITTTTVVTTSQEPKISTASLTNQSVAAPYISSALKPSKGILSSLHLTFINVSIVVALLVVVVVLFILYRRRSKQKSTDYEKCELGALKPPLEHQAMSPDCPAARMLTLPDQETQSTVAILSAAPRAVDSDPSTLQAEVQGQPTSQQAIMEQAHRSHGDSRLRNQNTERVAQRLRTPANTENRVNLRPDTRINRIQFEQRVNSGSTDDYQGPDSIYSSPRISLEHTNTRWHGRALPIPPSNTNMNSGSTDDYQCPDSINSSSRISLEDTDTRWHGRALPIPPSNTNSASTSRASTSRVEWSIPRNLTYSSQTGSDRSRPVALPVHQLYRGRLNTEHRRIIEQTSSVILNTVYDNNLPVHPSS